MRYAIKICAIIIFVFCILTVADFFWPFGFNGLFFGVRNVYVAFFSMLALKGISILFPNGKKKKCGV